MSSQDFKNRETKEKRKMCACIRKEEKRVIFWQIYGNLWVILIDEIS